MPEPGPASRIGRYQLVSPIGAGGMGRVWVALDTAAPALRLVALKTTLGNTEVEPGSEFWAMLSDEAALASRINHPNVCATFELGQDASIHYLVMEWSDGTSLRELLDAAPGKRLEPTIAAFIAASVAAGLHAAHELTDEQGQSLGVVHRDVSPQNVLVSLRGHVRLADFGVAKARGQQHRATETGEVKGKLSYMAPEQVTSKSIDRRADVFALGCVLYEVTLGVRPFHGADALATMYKILEQDLTLPSSLDPSFPPELEQVLVKALAKDANARYQSADELREALVEYLSSTKRFFADKHVAELLTGALGTSLRERNRAILASAEQLRRGETDPSRLDSPPPPPPTHTLTPDGGVERSVSAPRLPPRNGPRSTLVLALGGLVVTLAGLMVWRESSGKAALPRAPVVGAALEKPPVARVEEPTREPVAVAPTPQVSAPASAEPALLHKPTSRVAPRPAAPSSSLSGQSTALPKPVTKKPRPIDRSNPFATP